MAMLFGASILLTTLTMMHCLPCVTPARVSLEDLRRVIKEVKKLESRADNNSVQIQKLFDTYTGDTRKSPSPSPQTIQKMVNQNINQSNIISALQDQMAADRQNTKDSLDKLSVQSSDLERYVYEQTLLIKDKTRRLETRNARLENTLMFLQQRVENISVKNEFGDVRDRVKDCSSLYKRGYTLNTVYMIPAYTGPFVMYTMPSFNTYCDMQTDGGGWTVIQRRVNGSVNFDRNWTDYKFGFGDKFGEYWLGNENIYRITNERPNKLRVMIEDWMGMKAYAEYSTFSISSERDGYRLSLGEYSGGLAGDSIRNQYNSQNSMAFSTKDRDNDSSPESSCAQRRRGGWWYSQCGWASLNGLYRVGGQYLGRANGIIWFSWGGSFRYSMKKVTMMVRPADF
ncbi:angiopoietin-related protein 7-like [Branchiostoma lanceolatum]|uniref:angiopoietin-related protein 7-like n=1 Tax=Branchiostoma lanceolatum TaxID=7740 RepID=UPI0011331338